MKEDYMINNMAETLKLFKTWSTPYGLRVVWALKLKAVPYDAIDEDLSNKSALLLQYNPVYKKVPVLLHNGKPISETLVILEYIDETWKQNPMLPEDPLEKARQRFWAKFSDEKLIPSIWGAFTKEGQERDEAIAASLENLKFVEEELKGKTFFGGEKIGLADLVFGWLAILISVFEEVTGLRMIDDRFPLILAWMQRFSDIHIVKDNWPPHDKLVVKYQALYEKFHPAK